MRNNMKYMTPARRRLDGSSRRRRGFSLLELIVTMGVIAIAVAVTVPVLWGLLPGWRVRSAARDLASVMQEARLKAASNSVEFRVGINPTAEPFSVQMEQGDRGSGSVTWVCLSNKSRELSSDVLVEEPTPGSTEDNDFTVCRPDGTTETTTGFYVTFRPNGSTAVGSEFRVQLQTADGATQYQIRVSNTTGRVRVEDFWSP